MPIENTIAPVLESHDMGHVVYDVVLEAHEIHRMFKHGLIVIDDDKQRGVNSVTGKQVFKKEKVDRWTAQLLKDEHVFGQLTWNFRPESTAINFVPEAGALQVLRGAATLPDSAHRHRAIFAAVESVERGSSFDPTMKFSVRIWNVAAEAEGAIFYGMNQEGDKADATRSKYLIQRNIGQRLARDLVRRNRQLTEQNVEVVSNTLSSRNPRLTAFNTVSVACEQTFGEIAEDQFETVAEYLDAFWTRLVDVRPELGVLALAERQRTRKTLISGSALAIHAYLGLARDLFNRVDVEGLDVDLDVLERLRAPEEGPDFMALDQPEWQARGIVVPGTNRAGERSLTVRQAIQTRRAMTEALVDRVVRGIDRSQEPANGDGASAEPVAALFAGETMPLADGQHRVAAITAVLEIDE